MAIYAGVIPDELFDSQDHCDCHCHAGNTMCPTCGKIVPEWERFKAEGLG